MKDFLKKWKWKLIAICCLVVLLIYLITSCGGIGGSGNSVGSDVDQVNQADQSGGKVSETARTIVVEETNGTTVVLDEAKESTNAYKGMHLFSGNDVTVQKISDLTMLLDMDKYLYAEEKTHFWLEASGSRENSQTVIYVDEGAELNRITSPLSSGSVYQVSTPNSTMAVRGTTFRVEVRKGSDGKIYTYLAVFSGAVKVELKNTEGEFNGVTETFQAGQAAAIRADEKISEFIVGAGGNIALPIDYEAFPSTTVEKLIEYIDDGEEIAVDREELEKLIEAAESQWGEIDGHIWHTVTVRSADCTHTGFIQSVCSVCGETTNEQIIPMKPHTKASQWTTEKEATCTEAGIQVKTCSVCGKVLESRQTELKAHQPGEAVTLEATCTEAGSVTVSCVNCGLTLEEQVIEALGHQPGEWVVTKPADYGVEGSQSRFCTVCGELLDIQSIPALTIDYVPPVTPSCNHNWSAWTVTKAATCTEAGEETRTCTLCGRVETETLTALGHSWSEWTVTKAATCEEVGEETRTCGKCGETETRTIDALGHDWGEFDITTPATCEETGIQTRTCAICDETEEETIDALGHEVEIITTITTDGKTKYEETKCVRENCDYWEKIEIYKLTDEGWTFIDTVYPSENL